MSGTFLGIETAARALRMNQAVLDVIGHNVANVDTPGYSRQTAQIRATDPHRSHAAGLSVLAMGTGVELASVTRVRDEFVEQRLNDALADQGKYRQLNESMTRVQTVFNEVGGEGLNSALTAFFNSFQDLSRHPEGAGPRTMVQHRASEVAQRFRDIHGTLDGAKSDIADRIRQTIGRVNEMAREIAGLNAEVQKAIALGGQPNDISDRRDGLVQELTKLIGGDIVVEQDGTGRKTGAVNISVGGVPLVQSTTAVPLPAAFETRRGEPVLLAGSERIPVKSGEISGLIRASENVDAYLTDLNVLASGFIVEVNTQHRAGYGLDGQTDRPLFAGTDASNIALDTIVANDSSVIAAASRTAGGEPPPIGNGENARAIANIAHQALFGTMTIQERYAQTVTRVGADARSIEDQETSQAQVVQQITNLRNSISGVSMDEELARMLTFQRAYQAAARLLSTYDEVIGGLLDAVAR